MNHTKYIIGFFLVISIIFLVGCAQKGNVVKEKETIKVGFIAPLSGPAASWGETELDGVRMAVDEINSKGGILGKQLEIIAEDGKCTGRDATLAAQKLVNIDNVKVILGGACSSETLAIAPITEQSKVVLLTGVSSNPGISDAGEYIFRLTPTDKDFFSPEADYFYEVLGYRKVAVLLENTDYCLSGRDAFVDEFKKLGGEVVDVQIASPDEKDYRTYITKMKAKNPEAVVLIPQSALVGGLMAKQVRELWPDIKILGSYSMESKECIEASAGGMEGAIVFSIASDIPSSRDLVNRYKARYGKDPMDPFLPVQGWDRTFIVKQAIEHCKGLDTDCMKDYIYNTEFDLGLGKYRFNSKGDIKVFYVGVYKIENNTAIPIEPYRKIVKD